MTSKQTLADEARLYAPNAEAAISREDWRGAVSLLLIRCKRLDMALQSLTPGGSEYVGDPDRCVAHAKKLIKQGQEDRLELARKP